MAKRIKYCEINELESLFKIIKDPRDRAIFELGLRRGLRASEVGKLRMEDYRKVAGRLFVSRAKGSISADYPLLKSEIRALHGWLRIRGSQPGPIFITRNHAAISQQMLDVLAKRYFAAAGLSREKAHFHVLRHSCAMWLLEMGRGLEEVQDWLGHKNIQNTVIYARISGRRRQRIVDELERDM